MKKFSTLGTRGIEACVTMSNRISKQETIVLYGVVVHNNNDLNHYFDIQRYWQQSD